MEENRNDIENQSDQAARIEVRSYFVRERNALAVRADFSELYVDYYLHFMDRGIRYAPEHDQMLKDALAALVLHMTSKPWAESHAWTLNYPESDLSLFVTGSSLQQNVVGRIFTEGLRRNAEGLFRAQVSEEGKEPRMSAVPLNTENIFRAVEGFYSRSEQRPARILRFSEEDFVMVSAQPECDEEWLRGLDEDAVRRLDEEEELSLLEKRYFSFDCGCTLDKIFPAFASLAQRGLDDLFQGDEAITVTCPRCAAQWRVTREQMEAVMAS